jgi:serine phosphatase RsbU (regulator of sigma subunit)
VIYGAARRRLLTTLCYAVIDTRRGVLSMASAGHLYPYRVAADGHLDVLESTAYPLGVRETLSLETREVVLEPGDCLFFASDGLVEFRRLGGEEPFGFERLERSLARAGGRGAAALRDAVLHDLERFIGSGTRVDLESCAREDDLTILVVQLEDVGQDQ